MIKISTFYLLGRHIENIEYTTMYIIFPTILYRTIFEVAQKAKNVSSTRI